MTITKTNNVTGPTVINTVNGYQATIYGIVRSGFVSELDGWKWIANVMGKPLLQVKKNYQYKMMNNQSAIA